MYLANDTAIVPVLRALVAHPEFIASKGLKVRNPADDVVATWRVLDVQAAPPTGDGSGANAVLWQTVGLGQAPFDWARPDGQPEDGASWSSVSRVLASFETHYTLCGGWWPTAQTTYHPVASWVPLQSGQSMRFDALVEHLSRRLPRPDRADPAGRGVLPGHRAHRGDLDHAQPRPREVGHARPADHRARQPRAHEPLT